METVLLDCMREVNNFFIRSSEVGKFEIIDGIIQLKNKHPLKSYIALTGSILNDGVYLIGDDLITLEDVYDEEFEGVIYQLAVPRDFIRLSEEIGEYIQRYPQTNMTSYTFAESSADFAVNKDGQVSGWRDIFAARLNKYRNKMFKEISL